MSKLWYQGSGINGGEMKGTVAYVDHMHERKRVYAGEGESKTLICACESDTLASEIVDMQNYTIHRRLTSP